MTARDYALLELDATPLPGWTPDLPGRSRSHSPSDPRDLALAEHIVIGVIKNLFLLRQCLVHYSGKSLDSMDTLLQKIMVIGLYQLKFLDRVPPSAAVDEAVKQAKHFGRAKAAGFVNAVLRNATRKLPPEPPDRQTHPMAFAERALSHPSALFTKLVQVLGADAALQFCEHNNSEPPTLVRLNAGIEPAALNEPGVTILSHERPGMLLVQGARQATFARWASAGLAQVQDATAAAVVEAMDLQPGQTVLDRCAGLGTKTMQIHQRVGGSGCVYAVDPSTDRCEVLKRLLVERGIKNVHVHVASALAAIAGHFPRTFDRILLDVPCSNSGVMARRADARYHQDPAAIDSLAGLQARILDDTAAWLAPSGKMIYSTCSIWPEENEQQVENFLQRHPGWHVIEQKLTLPSFDDPDPKAYHDGGFIAIVVPNDPKK